MLAHRELARDLDLFHFEEHSPGMVFWHPQGLRLLRSIEDFMRQVYQAREFEEVRSPVVLNRSLWERSRHWEKFRQGMFVVGSVKADADIDESALSIIEPNKIRELSKRKIPLIAIVGEQEAMSQRLNLRCLGAIKQQEMSLAELEDKLANLSMS